MKPSERGIKLLRDNGIGEIELRGLKNNHLYLDLLKDGQLYSICFDLTDAIPKEVESLIKDYVVISYNKLKSND